MKLAVFFPGIGYHTDKPLLYYSRKLAKEQDYEIREVCYQGFSPSVKGSKEKMTEAFYQALMQAEEILSDVSFAAYEEVLFVSKSLGTAVAAAYAGEHGLTTRNVYFTPVAASFPFMKQPGIVFHGSMDTWVKTRDVLEGCEKRKLPLFILRGTNHSLESGDAMIDLFYLQKTMEQVKRYLSGEELPAGTAEFAAFPSHQGESESKQK